tara:strand:- start:4315 stop:4749 length:435 start_codon:yes stop_codon:yes gene_type:complete
MVMKKWVRLSVAAALSLGATGAFAVSPGGTAPSGGRMTALRQLEAGQWELRERGVKQPANPQRVCVGDPAQLLQVKHGNGGCSRFVVADTNDHAVVTYQCNGRGNGRTDIRVETPRLIQINSQGVADGAPFAVSLEGRRTGDCP